MMMIDDDDDKNQNFANKVIEGYSQPIKGELGLDQ